MTNSSSLLKKGLILSSLMMVTVGSIVPGITHAADGLFGTYFQRMTGPCTVGSVLTGFSTGATSTPLFGTKTCTSFSTFLGIPTGYTAPPGQAVVGYSSTGALRFGSVNWIRSGSVISYTGSRVGIGTVSPLATLEVAGGSVSIRGGQLIIQRPPVTGGWSRGLMYTPDASVDPAGSGLAGIGLLGNATTENSLYLTFGPAPWASATGLRVRSNGNVGVGTTNPTEKFQVVGGDALINGIRVGRGSGAITTSVVLGNNSLMNNIANYNTAISPSSALMNNTLGSYNTAVGYQALMNNSIGARNTAIGVNAGFSSTGDRNTFLGMFAGSNLTSGTGNIALGYNTQLRSSTGSYQMNIGNLIYGTGMTGGGNGYVGIGTNNPTAKLDVNGNIRIRGSSPISSGMVLMTDDTGLARWTNFSGDIPVGSIVPFNLSSCPAGWTPANGTAGAPDLRGEFIRGLDSGRGVDTGRVLGSSQADMFRSHSHNQTVSNRDNGGNGYDGIYPASANNPINQTGSPYNTAVTGGTETRPRNVALLYCMKIAGSAPTPNFTWTSMGGTSSSNVTLATTGRVGIGTLSPTAKLDVMGITGNQSTLRVTASDGATVATGWPAGWSGIQTWDLLAMSAKLNGGLQVAGDTTNIGDIIMNGQNGWRLHSPDDGRTSLWLGKQTNDTITGWPYEFRQDGRLIVGGGIQFPDGTIQTTAGGGGGASNGYRLYYPANGVLTTTCYDMGENPGGCSGPAYFETTDWTNTYRPNSTTIGWFTEASAKRVNVRVQAREAWDWPAVGTVWTFGPGQMYPFDTEIKVWDNVNNNHLWLTVRSDGNIRYRGIDWSSNAGGVHIYVESFY